LQRRSFRGRDISEKGARMKDALAQSAETFRGDNAKLCAL
jgi:hypothetical protein